MFFTTNLQQDRELFHSSLHQSCCHYMEDQMQKARDCCSNVADFEYPHRMKHCRNPRGSSRTNHRLNKKDDPKYGNTTTTFKHWNVLLCKEHLLITKNLLAQDLIIHILSSLESPMHGSPSSSGKGFEQDLSRFCNPTPHETEQLLQDDQTDHSPSAACLNAG